MKVRSTMTALLACSLLAAVACDDEDEDPNGPPDTQTFQADLTGAAERPTPVTTTATGDATFTAVTNGGVTTITYSVVVNGNLSGPLTAAHIHGPAGPNEVASPVVTLNLSGSALTGTLVSGSFTTTGTATTMAQLLAMLEAGNAYVNIHTAANPGGELRGQISD